MAIRQAVADDLPSVRALAGRYGLLGEWPARPDWLDHLLASGGLWIAREDGCASHRKQQSSLQNPRCDRHRPPFLALPP